MKETERIRIYPASREQMERMIAAERDDDLKKANADHDVYFGKENA